MQGCLRLVYIKVELGLRVVDSPVDIDNARRLLKDRLHFLRNTDLACFVRSEDLGDERLDDWGAGRDFADLDASAKGKA